MSDNNRPPLCDTLDRDPEAMKFFRSLPVGLQRSLMNGTVAALEELRQCSSRYDPDDELSMSGRQWEYSDPAVSATECTGLIPNGADRSRDDFDGYKQLFPFADPPADKQ